MNILRVVAVALLTILLILTAFAGGYLLRDWMQGPQHKFPILNEAYQILLENGLNPPPDPPALEYGMVHGMVSAYRDPYTIFVEPPQTELQGDALHGSFGGIGASLAIDPDGFWAIFPYSDSPASQAGIQDGDRLLAVDGVSISSQTNVDTIQSAIRGPVGSKVMLTTARPPEYLPQEIAIERAEIPIPSVIWRQDLGESRVGIIKVNLIAASTPQEIEEAIADLQSRQVTHFILDLRDNPGGLLSAGVDIARLFLIDGIIMQQQYRGEEVQTYEVEKPGKYSQTPLAVIINQGSASAAEITAGAIQAHKRAPLVGSPSFGKDSVQLIFVLQDSSSLHVTSARWWIPGLVKPVGEGGLQPDLPSISSDPQTDSPILTAIDYLMAR